MPDNLRYFPGTQPAGHSTAVSNDIILGISGASGLPYTQALLDALLHRTAARVHLITTPSAARVLQEELGIATNAGQLDVLALLGKPFPNLADRIVHHPFRDIGALPASGTFQHRGMVICPASMNTMGSLAAGVADNLLTRAADVCLKERRRLVLVPRETPLSTIHLRSMLTLAEAGAIILPAMPGFYHRPKSVADILDFLAMKILDQLGLTLDWPHRWKPERAGS